jgi:hypothetical protein
MIIKYIEGGQWRQQKTIWIRWSVINLFVKKKRKKETNEYQTLSSKLTQITHSKQCNHYLHKL